MYCRIIQLINNPRTGPQCRGVAHVVARDSPAQMFKSHMLRLKLKCMWSIDAICQHGGALWFASGSAPELSGRRAAPISSKYDGPVNKRYSGPIYHHVLGTPIIRISNSSCASVVCGWRTYKAPVKRRSEGLAMRALKDKHWNASAL